ncbi:prepilin peptidase [Serratia plymuthica]|uniref:prepilin peptidase n=1 Tax=Serratia plymuthica TaxID=82996 RepID=UPI0007E9CF8B|nr:A24 family peptidase [Serratia plymuthica]ANJ99176.1 peptidase A24 [Serratia plymuthica]
MLDDAQHDLWHRCLFIPALLLAAAIATRLIHCVSASLPGPSPKQARWVMGAALCAGLAALPFGMPLLHRVVLLPVAAVLIALAFIDWRHRLLPDRLTLPLLWAGLLVNQQGYFTSLAEAVSGAVVGYLSLWLLNAAYRRRHQRDGIGQGDFKLLAALGAWVGWPALPMLVTGAAATGLCAVAIACLMRKPGWQAPLPFGLYLAAAAWPLLLSAAGGEFPPSTGYNAKFHLISLWR